MFSEKWWEHICSHGDREHGEGIGWGWDQLPGRGLPATVPGGEAAQGWGEAGTVGIQNILYHVCPEHFNLPLSLYCLPWHGYVSSLNLVCENRFGRFIMTVTLSLTCFAGYDDEYKWDLQQKSHEMKSLDGLIVLMLWSRI